MTRKPSPILALLAVLLCQVLFVAECQALAGGPIYPGTRISTTGVYSGVMNGLLSNSLGLFTVSLTRQGVGAGQAVVFRNGFFFSGTLQAVADPDSTNVSGVFDLQYAYSYTVADSGNAVVVTVTISASGLMRATVDQTRSRFGASGIRLNGNAVITATLPPTTQSIPIDPGLLVPVNFQISGFKQAEL